MLAGISSSSFLPSITATKWCGKSLENELHGDNTYLLLPNVVNKLLLHLPIACMAALQGVANRDVKLENTLLVSSARPLIKLCDFGYSKVRIKAMHLLLSSEGSPQVLFSEDLLFLFFRTKSSSRLQAPKWERQHIWPRRSSQPPGAGPMMARQVSPNTISFGDLFDVSLCTCEAICGWEVIRVLPPSC